MLLVLSCIAPTWIDTKSERIQCRVTPQNSISLSLSESLNSWATSMKSLSDIIKRDLRGIFFKRICDEPDITYVTYNECTVVNTTSRTLKHVKMLHIEMLEIFHESKQLNHQVY